MNFPIICTVIPGIQNFTVYIDNDMFDNTYFAKYANIDGIPQTDLLGNADLYGAIEQAFMGTKCADLITFGQYVDVYCNLDTAYGLVENIDSWVSERKIQLTQGRWPGK